MSLTILQMMAGGLGLKAYGTSEGASKGWDIRGRIGKQIHQGVSGGMRVARGLDHPEAKKTFGTLSQMYQNAKASGSYSKKDVSTIMKLANKHTRIGMKENPDDEGKRSKHDTLADHLVNGAQQASWKS